MRKTKEQYLQLTTVLLHAKNKPHVIGYLTTQLPYSHIIKPYPDDYKLEQLIFTNLLSIFVVLSCLELL